MFFLVIGCFLRIGSGEKGEQCAEEKCSFHTIEVLSFFANKSRENSKERIVIFVFKRVNIVIYVFTLNIVPLFH